VLGVWLGVLYEPGVSSEERKALKDLLQRENPESALDLSEVVEWLLAALRPIEQFVIRQYYLQDESMKAIGAALGLSESRVCQIHAAALARLRRESRAIDAGSGSGSRD